MIEEAVRTLVTAEITDAQPVRKGVRVQPYSTEQSKPGSVMYERTALLKEL
jgi:hypothetical protein